MSSKMMISSVSPHMSQLVDEGRTEVQPPWHQHTSRGTCTSSDMDVTRLKKLTFSAYLGWSILGVSVLDTRGSK